MPASLCRSPDRRIGAQLDSINPDVFADILTATLTFKCTEKVSAASRSSPSRLPNDVQLTEDSARGLSGRARESGSWSPHVIFIPRLKSSERIAAVAMQENHRRRALGAAK